MRIVTRRIELTGVMPAMDERPGQVGYVVTFEVSTEAGDFELKVNVSVPSGIDGILEKARENLVSIFSDLKESAENGSLGLDPVRIF